MFIVTWNNRQFKILFYPNFLFETKQQTYKNHRLLLSDLDADLDPSNENWDACVHLTSDHPGQGALCASAPGHLWTVISCLSFLLWHLLSLHLSTPPPIFLPPSLHPSHPPLTEDDVTFCQTARDHATVTVGCSVYTEIESNKSYERERESERRRGDGGKNKKKSGQVTEEKMCCRASGLDVVCQSR